MRLPGTAGLLPFNSRVRIKHAKIQNISKNRINKLIKTYFPQKKQGGLSPKCFLRLVFVLMFTSQNFYGYISTELETCVASVRESGGDMNWVLLGRVPWCPWCWKTPNWVPGFFCLVISGFFVKLRHEETRSRS